MEQWTTRDGDESYDWTFIPSENSLVRGSEVARLTPTAAAVLGHLIKRRGAIVSREDLLNEVWPGLHVTPDLVREYVFHLRAALGDDAKTPRYIQTVRGKGFRLLGGVEIGDHAPAPGSPDPGLRPPRSGELAATLDKLRVADAAYKTVTALSCAIANSAAPADRMASEAAYELMEAFVRAARAIVERHEGMLIQYLGDGFLALFGAPVTHEDDARRAVLAALELNASLNGEGASTGAPLLDRAQKASIGLATGPVVVGTLGRDRAAQTYTARGATVETAKRLQGEAAGGSILLDAFTYEALKWEIRAEVKPAAEDSGPVFSLRGLRRARAGVQTRVPGSELRLLGRRQELAILSERFNRARAGNPQLVGLIGPPGIGKSRLMEEFRGSISRGSVTVLDGHCVPHCKDTPLTPLLHVLRNLCNIEVEDDAATAAERLKAQLDQAQMGADLIPPLLDVLGLHPGEDWHNRLGPNARRAKTFDALEALILGAARQWPVALILEDIHWIDASSEEWLSAFVSRLEETAIFLLFTCRPPRAPPWAAKVPATQLALPPLNRRDSSALARQVLKHGAKSRRSLVSGIVDKSAGNPFYVVELSSAANAQEVPSVDELLPETVQAVVLSRIDRLPAVDRSILRIASVIGNQFSYALLKAVCNIEDETIGIALDTLQDEGFLRRSLIVPDLNYTFRHALIEEVAYHSLALKSRADIHRRVARAMEQEFPRIKGAQPEVVARHLELAGDVDPAIAYWRRAARRAYERSANSEAIAYARSGLSLLERSTEADRHEEELELILTLAPALVATRGYGAEELAPLYARANALCSGSKDRQALFRALIGIWNFHWVRGELDSAHQTAAQLRREATRDGQPKNALRAHAANGEVLFHMGDLRGSLDCLLAGIAHYEAAPRHTMSTQVPQVACLCYAAWALWHRGRLDEALMRADQASSLAATLSHPLSISLSLALISEFHQFRLEIAPCRALSQQAIAVSKEQRFPFWEGTAKVLYGWALAMAEDFERGRRIMLEGYEIFCGTGARIQRAAWLGMLAEVHHRAGRYDEAMSSIEDAFGWVERTGERHYLSELHRLRGEIARGLGGPDAGAVAAKSYGAAIEVARAQGALMRELRATVSLARLLRDEGRGGEVPAMLQRHHGLLDGAGTCVDIANARDLRDHL